MFADGFCAFGQTGAAQSHLAHCGVRSGDVFLFFGLFAEQNTGERHQRIFGYLEVNKVVTLGATPVPWQGHPFPRQHPHTIGEWNANNALYFGEGATCRNSPDILRLTAPGGPPSLWHVPPWLNEVGLSYHSRVERWLPGNRLKAAARGQEFVADIERCARAQDWLKKIILKIEE